LDIIIAHKLFVDMTKLVIDLKIPDMQQLSHLQFLRIIELRVDE